jgi:hypothetical protein
MKSILYFNRFLVLIMMVFLLLFLHLRFFSSKKKEKSLSVHASLLERLKPEKVLYLPKEAIDNFGEGLFGLRDLRCQRLFESHFIFLGFDSRPDRDKNLYFFRWRDKEYQLDEGEPFCFDSLDHNELSSFYFLKQGDHIELKALESSREIFSLIFSNPESSEQINIGEYRFDTNFFVRQKLSWAGVDLFFQKYGAEDYPKYARSQRLDFQGSKGRYSCFLEEGDLLIYKDQKWQPAEGETHLYPLLQCQKIDKTLMTLKVWNQGGRAFRIFSISKTNNPFSRPVLAPLKFVGAKTNHKWVIQSIQDRFTLQEGDWLILEKQNWIKMTQLSELEAYIDQVNLSELLVVKELKHISGNRYLIGDLFNGLRTHMETIEIQLITK